MGGGGRARQTAGGNRPGAACTQHARQPSANRRVATAPWSRRRGAGHRHRRHHRCRTETATVIADALVAVMDGTAIGTVVREPSGRLRFDYADAWRRHSDAVPLSLSMPLVRATHPHAVVDAFLWGLLPDNEQILARWSRQFHVSARNAFGL